MDKQIKILAVLAMGIALLALALSTVSLVPLDESQAQSLSRVSRLWVTSNRDQVALEVEGYITQTTNIVEVQKSDDTKLVKIDNSGNISTTGLITATGTGSNYFAGNVGIGTTGPTTAQTISGTLTIGSNPTAPSAGNYLAIWGNATTTPTLGANTAAMFARDVSGTTELFSMDEAGSETQQTPHNFDQFTPDANEKFPWSYYACNRYLGTCINVDMAGAIRAIEQLSGEQFIYYEDLPENEVLSWAERPTQVEVEVAITEATEAYSETVSVETGEWITATTVTYEFDTETGQTIEATEVVTASVTVDEPTGKTLYRLREGCRLDEQIGQVYCYVDAEPKPMPGWMQDRIVTIFLAPKDISGIPKPEGQYKKLMDVGNYSLWMARAEAETLLGLHEALWDMNPKQTLGCLAAVQTYGDKFYTNRVRKAVGMTQQQALAQRDRIADYLDSLGKDTKALRRAATEDKIVRGIVESLRLTMDQLWDAMRE